MAFPNYDDQLIRPEGVPWPPAPVVQKLYRSRQQSAFGCEAEEVLVDRLGYYCDLQSVHSEDALTWNFFGPLLSRPQSEQAMFLDWLLDRLEPGATPNRTGEIDLWRRITHPDSQVPGGPEIDFVLTGDQCVIFGEAKWHASEGKGQGLQGNKTQLQLRSEFLSNLGAKIYGNRKFHVLFVTPDHVGALDSHGPMVTNLTWEDLCAYPQHPMRAEVGSYYRWKRKHSR